MTVLIPRAVFLVFSPASVALGKGGSAALWVTVGPYGIFGWMNDAYFNGETIEAVRNGLR